MDNLHTPITSLPVLPVSLRSAFTSLPGGVRGVVRGYFLRVFQSLWPFRPHLSVDSFPSAFIFLLPGVLTRLGYSIQDITVLSSIYFLSGGGKRGVLTPELIELTGIDHIYHKLIKLQKAGYLYRNYFDPSSPSRDKDHKFRQYRYIFITAEGVRVLHGVNGAFRSAFYGVINRAAFGSGNDRPMKFERNKKPGPTK